MAETSLYLMELLAQRRVISQNFHSCKKNLDDNTRALMACLCLLRKTKSNGQEASIQRTLFLVKNAAELVEAIRENTDFVPDDLLLLLQLILYRQQSLTDEVIRSLGQSADPALQLMAAELALRVGENTGKNLYLSSGLSAFVKDNFAAYHVCLLGEYYQNTLREAVSSAVNPGESEAWQDISTLEAYIVSQTPLSRLYLRVLLTAADSTQAFITTTAGRREYEPQLLLRQFIEHEYLNSHLFEIFIVSLDEAALTRVINYLSTRQEELAADQAQEQSEKKSPAEHLMFVMALSGYSKFIPFLARYLQQPAYRQQAFTALRLLLGNKLDLFIPLAIQFASDEEQRLTDLGYYGAKILATWQQMLTVNQMPAGLQAGQEAVQGQQTEQETGQKGVPPRLFDGLPLTLENIERVLIQGSLLHYRYARLYQKVLAPQQRGSYYLAVAG